MNNVTLAEIKAIKTVVVDGIWDKALLPETTIVRTRLAKTPVGEVVYLGGVPEAGLLTIQILNMDTLYVKTLNNPAESVIDAFEALMTRFLELTTTV